MPPQPLQPLTDIDAMPFPEDKTPPVTRAGMVAFAGRPNAGKSTLLNRFIGQKLAITSPKPQSTRDRVVGIVTTDSAQMIILDTPGLLDPRYALQEAMQKTAVRALEDSDVIVHVVDALDDDGKDLQELAGLPHPLKPPIIVAVNKTDRLREMDRAPALEKRAGSVLISATTGEGIDDLRNQITSRLPESPFLYPEDDISTQPVRFFVAEMIRETVLEQLQDEVPYSVACEVEEYREGRSPVFIRAVIFVERDSQKGIVVGAKGARIREIGKASRAKIESFIGSSVYLDLFIKVLPNWRRDAGALKRFGYQTRKEEKR